MVESIIFKGNRSFCQPLAGRGLGHEHEMRALRDRRVSASMLRRFLKRLFLPPLIVFAALLMFLEEWLWNHLVNFTKWVAKARVFRWIEAKLAALPPYAAMAVLLGPAALLLPVKLIAVYLMTQGKVKTGIAIILAAKVIGTAIVARLFTVCRPALMSVPWFRRLFESILRLKERLYTAIKSMAAWKFAVRVKNRIKSWMPRGGRFRRMWKALGEVLRKKFFPKKRGSEAAAVVTKERPHPMPGAPALKPEN
jgi:hypothetical protein